MVTGDAPHFVPTILAIGAEDLHSFESVNAAPAPERRVAASTGWLGHAAERDTFLTMARTRLMQVQDNPRVQGRFLAVRVEV